MRTPQEKRDMLALQRKKDGQSQSAACVFLALELNCLAIQKFGENIVDVAETVTQNNLFDMGWVGVSVASCLMAASWATTSCAVAWQVGQNLTDINYRDKTRELEISLLGEPQVL